MEKMFEGSTAIVEKFAPEKPELAQRMKKFGETLNSTLADVSLPKPGQFCSMLHGDCWNNNFMFKYDDEGNLKAIKVVDYQLMRYGCIAHDLVSTERTRISVSIEVSCFFGRWPDQVLSGK